MGGASQLLGLLQRASMAEVEQVVDTVRVDTNRSVSRNVPQSRFVDGRSDQRRIGERDRDGMRLISLGGRPRQLRLLVARRGGGRIASRRHLQSLPRPARHDFAPRLTILRINLLSLQIGWMDPSFQTQPRRRIARFSAFAKKIGNESIRSQNLIFRWWLKMVENG